MTVSRLLCEWEALGSVGAAREVVLVHDVPALLELSREEEIRVHEQEYKKMLVLRNGWIALLFLTLGLPVFAQSDVTTDATTQDSPTANREVHRARVGIPCWRQAGMTADMVNRRWELEDQQKGKIAQVCTEPSTSPQQKHDKIDQIHAETDRAIAQLIPTKELVAFNKCQADLDRRRPKGVGQKELGPCGGTIPTSVAADPTTAPEHRHTNTPPNQ